MDENKITAVVVACMSEVVKSANPYRSINDSLAKLKRHGWSDEERLAVQTQLLQELKRRKA